MRPALVALVVLLGCASDPPRSPQVIERERVVYIETPAPETERPPVGEAISESPLVVEAERDRAENRAERVELERAKAPVVVHAPTPRTAVVIRSELPPSQRLHTKWWYERAAERCERRGTEWSRERCLREVARR